MKKLVFILLIIVMLAVSGCNTPAFKYSSEVVLEESAPEVAASVPSGDVLMESISVPQSEVSAASEGQIIVDLICGQFVYDVSVPEQAAYYHDYIFAAEILEVGENYDPYFEPAYVEKHGSVPFYDPCYTKYKLKVTEVIKGELEVGQVIDARKFGYYEEETGNYYLGSNDVYPQLGIEYLFLTKYDELGQRHVCSAPYTCIPLEPVDEPVTTYSFLQSEIEREWIMDRYYTAYKEQTP